MARILIVDDDPDLREVASLVLDQDGHEVTSAENRTTGMQAVEDFAPELLILDVMMEQADDGIAMARELRRNGFDAPILMLTCMPRVSDATFDRDDDMVPVTEVYEKPIDSHTLVEKVASLLSQ